MEKADFFIGENLVYFESVYYGAWEMLEDYPNADEATFKAFVASNKKILNGLTAKVVGYDAKSKIYQVKLDERKLPILEEGISEVRAFLD